MEFEIKENDNKNNTDIITEADMRIDEILRYASILFPSRRED